MGRPEGKTFCENALGLEETHVQRTGGKGGERERERERGLEGSSRGVCGVEVVWVAVLSREQRDPPLQESQGAQGAEKGEQLAERAPQCNPQPFDLHSFIQSFFQHPRTNFCRALGIYVRLLISFSPYNPNGKLLLSPFHRCDK